LLSDMEYVEGLKLKRDELEREIAGAERAVEFICERGETCMGEIGMHLSDIEILQTQHEFAGYAIAILEMGELPERITAPRQKKLGGITDLDIETARAYPIENLVEAKRNRAHCVNPEHRDENPSMDIRNNFAFCYACQWSGDSIKVYQAIHGCSFIEAVKALNV